jgi:hypothetical protein
MPMMKNIPIALVAAATLLLSACATSDDDSGQGSSTLRQATGAAESACTAAVNGNYGGNVRSVQVASSEYSEANSVVMVDAAGVRGGSTTERWRCLVSNDGTVQELTVVQ